MHPQNTAKRSIEFYCYNNIELSHSSQSISVQNRRNQPNNMESCEENHVEQQQEEEAKNDNDNDVKESDEATNATNKRLLLRNWIGYYLTEFKFVSEYADNDETTQSTLRYWLSRYGLGSALQKTQDGMSSRSCILFFFCRIFYLNIFRTPHVSSLCLFFALSPFI